MHIGYHTADISLRIGPAVIFIFILANINILFYAITITKKMAMIYRIHFSVSGTLYRDGLNKIHQ